MRAYIPTVALDVLKIDTPQMIEVDRLMIEQYHIELIQMMENAGRCLAVVARERFLGQDPQGKKVVVLAGTGGNGGGALVAARRLHAWGAQVQVYLTKAPDQMTPVPAHQLQIVERMGILVKPGSDLPASGCYDLVIDGVLGYSVKGDPYGVAGQMIHWANTVAGPVLSLDTPSGLDLTSGTVRTPTVKADATLTLAMPKQGLFSSGAQDVVGDLFLGDISVPPELYEAPSLGLKSANLFRHSDIVQIDTGSSF